MSEIHIDTVKLKECGKDIITLSNELYEIIDTMFRRINNINKISGEWIGNSANEFVDKANIDKIQYFVMQNQIYQHGKYLIDYANRMENIIEEVKK